MALGTILGGLIGEGKAKDDYNRAEALPAEALKQFQDLYVPTIDEQKVNLDQYDYLGDYTPEREDFIELGPTAYEGISLDPSTRDAQMAALTKLQEYASNPEATAMDKAQMAGITADANRAAKGNRDAVMQNMRSRGMAGSGMEMVAQMAANQEAAEAANREGLSLAANAQQRALDSLLNSANLGGQIRDQDYEIEKNKAEARDRIAAFNTQNRQGVTGRNVDRNNQGTLRNLDTRQTINNQNTDTRNQQQTYNKGLYQTNFDNNMTKASGASGQLGQMADYRQNKADKTVDKYTGFGRGFDKNLETGIKMIGG